MWPFRQLHRNRILRQFPLADAPWRRILREHPVLAVLDETEERRLRDLATIFLQEKIIEPVKGLELTESMRLWIAALCCLPVMNLGMDWLDGWRTVIVYPGEFIRKREQIDDSGVMHEWSEVISGEAWNLGPLILSWADLEASGVGDAYNVAVHEIAHKLDLLNGKVNGFPPLHRDMNSKTWSMAFNSAYQDLNRKLDEGRDTPIDPYAGEEPGEFFAVLSEYFFERPDLVFGEYPEVYGQLAAFYRQDPLRRLRASRQVSGIQP